jgi:hypothetical protein
VGSCWRARLFLLIKHSNLDRCFDSLPRLGLLTSPFTAAPTHPPTHTSQAAWYATRPPGAAMLASYAADAAAGNASAAAAAAGHCLLWGDAPAAAAGGGGGPAAAAGAPPPPHSGLHGPAVRGRARGAAVCHVRGRAVPVGRLCVPRGGRCGAVVVGAWRAEHWVGGAVRRRGRPYGRMGVEVAWGASARGPSPHPHCRSYRCACLPPTTARPPALPAVPRPACVGRC